MSISKFNSNGQVGYLKMHGVMNVVGYSEGSMTSPDISVLWRDNGLCVSRGVQSSVQCVIADSGA